VIGSVALAALALAAGGVEREVAIPGKFFSPGREIVLIGDTVTWRNGDSSSHTVTADDLTFNSGSFGPGASFSRPFPSPGIYKYHCTIHRYMRAEVDVYGLALSAPGYAVPVGLNIVLKGLAPTAVGQVTLRRRRSNDGRFIDVGTAAVAADGSFRFPVTADGPAVFVAAAGSLTSGPAALAVAARLRVIAARKGEFASVTVSSEPAQPGALVELQSYVLERFDFLALRRGRLDASGRTVFRLKVRPKLHLRAVLPAGVRGYGRAVSPTVVVRTR
jgi:plastocyanin